MSVQVRSLVDVEVSRPRSGAAVVECRGEHDMSTRGEFAALLKQLLEDSHLVVVDVSEATFIDSSFINNLYIANGFAHRYDAHFRLQHSTAPVVHSVLQISGILDKLDCAHNREEALR
jgi:anti-anti-sigma factor